MQSEHEMQLIVNKVLAKPLNRIRYEDSIHCSSIEEVYPKTLNDTSCEINIYGEIIKKIRIDWSRYKMIQSLKKIHLKNVFFSRYVVFDECGNVFPDSFRLGPHWPNVALPAAIMLGENHFLFRRKKRDVIRTGTFEVLNKAFLFDIADDPLFGHFLIETVTRLWSEPTPGVNLLSSKSFPDYLLYYLQRFNLCSNDICVTKGVAFLEDLYINTQSVYNGQTFHPAAHMIYSRVQNQVENPYRKLYLGRTRYGKRKCINEDVIEQIMVKHGFEVIYPELLPVIQQSEIVSEARYIVGCVGSQMLHRLGLEDRKVLYVSPEGFPSIGAYVNIEKAYNNHFDVIYGQYLQKNNPYSDPWQCDIKNFEAGLVAWLEENS